jgi:galactonate dehydratase
VNRLKITGVEAFRVNPPHETWMFLAVRTDAGLTGWGEITGSTDDVAAAQLTANLGEALQGKDPINLNECTAPYYTWQYPVIKTNRIVSCVWSGIDQALWDLAAQYRGIPLYQMLGGCGNKRIELYANLNRALRFARTPESLQQNGEAARKNGFKVVKCTPFDEVNPLLDRNDIEKGLQRFEALLAVVPIERIAIDCHQRFVRYSLGRFIEMVVHKYGLPYWIEDPVPANDLDTMDRISTRYPEIRWAAGEDALGFKDLFALMKTGIYDILMPDIKYIGGVSVVKSFIPFAEGVGFKVTMHNPNGPISTAHSAHVSSLCRNPAPVEYPWGSSPERDACTTPSEPVRDGAYLLSDAPGIGIQPAAGFLKKYGEVWTDGKWSAVKKFQ